MSTGFDSKKLRRTTYIYAVVQVALIALLIFMAMNFQAGLEAQGRGFRFTQSIVVTLVMQLLIFYPVFKFAAREAKLMVESLAPGLTPEQLKDQRSKRIMGDVIKIGIFFFFIIFTWRAPADRFVQSIIFFNFILTYLSYFQCFNFVAKREIKGKA